MIESLKARQEAMKERWRIGCYDKQLSSLKSKLTFFCERLPLEESKLERANLVNRIHFLQRELQHYEKR